MKSNQRGKGPGEKHPTASAAVVTRRWTERIAQTMRQDNDSPRSLDELRVISRRSYWSLQLFLAISAIAFLVRDFNLYEALPESVLQILGCPPPPTLAHIALAGYIFTVLTPLAIHLLSGEQPVSQWRHLGYRSAFYAFYLFSNTLTANFIVVFTIGVTLYMLEQASICISIGKTNDGDGQLA